MYTITDTLTFVNSKVGPMVQRKTITVDDEVLSCCSPLIVESLSEEQAHDMAQIFGALSDPARILAEAGLITGEKRGRWTGWRVVPERLEEVGRLLST